MKSIITKNETKNKVSFVLIENNAAMKIGVQTYF